MSDKKNLIPLFFSFLFDPPKLKRQKAEFFNISVNTHYFDGKANKIRLYCAPTNERN